MQLDEFVKTTLMQVVKGVKEAQEAAAEFGAVVNPRPEEGWGKRRETNVSFDVALTVSDTSAGEIGGKLTVASLLNFGGKITETDLKQETSRIQFEVMMALPCIEEKKKMATPKKTSRAGFVSRGV
ncbi:TPA: hypothetical protein RQN00_001405 [Aeromonas dhakensis]|uniref:hypothetical protein n=1 Tax=Aeromonas enteropelogenes TaxID=29489 RepID=UPI00289160F8|nr:hypothetical protein [Aeromonas dhakensis]HDX8434079.1 hypothetical protein [Aeromonas dhakensis]HDZ8843846.1 hypothetical protein [Aeromonas dhakensis]